MEDIKSVVQKRSAGWKPRKAAEKRSYIDLPVAPSTTAPSSGDALVPLMEETSIAIGMKIMEISSLYHLYKRYLMSGHKVCLLNRCPLR